MDDSDRVRLSKLMSYALRHAPDEFGLNLDAAGWVALDDLIDAIRPRLGWIDRAAVLQVVRLSDKQRFAHDATSDRIRANQGHSLDVELNHRVAQPPAQLFHGTVDRFLTAIRREGLRAMERHAVHLSSDETTAERVARRRGKPVILTIDAERMAADGFEFRMTPNGVWLVDSVPPDYLTESA